MVKRMLSRRIRDTIRFVEGWETRGTPDGNRHAMSWCAGFGFSSEDDAAAAGRTVARQALDGLGGAEPRLAIVLATPPYQAAPLLDGMVADLHGTPLIGSTTPVLLTAHGLHTQGVGLLVIAGDDVTCATGSVTLAEGAASFDMTALAEQLFTQSDPAARRALIVLSHRYPGCSKEWLRSLQRHLHPRACLAGGALVGALRDSDSQLYYQDQSLMSGVVAALLGGAIRVGSGAAHGWHPIGAPRRTTQAKGRVIRTIDGAPAVGLYRDYFGQSVVQDVIGEPLPRMTVTYPLGITGTVQAEQPLVRTVQSIAQDGSLLCLGDVPQGTWARLMIANRESVLYSATRAASLAVAQVRDVRCALVLDSFARHRLLGSQAGDEVPALQRILGTKTPLLGGLTQMEIVPQYGADSTGGIEVQNDTMCVIVFGS